MNDQMLKKPLIQFISVALATMSNVSFADNNIRGVFIDTSAEIKVAESPNTVETNNVVTNVAGDEMIIIDGDTLDFDLDRNLNAYGDAIITQGKKSISGDELHYDLQNDELSVKGNAHIELGDGHISGPELRMRLNENIGEMKGASVHLYKKDNSPAVKLHQTSEIFSQSLGNYQSQHIGGESSDDLALPLSNRKSSQTAKTVSSRGDAETVLFEGQNKKHLKNARYTTCEAEVDDWYINAKDLKLNDYTESGVAKNAWIEFKGIPLIYSPWISFSYNQQRKSGFLAPTYGTTSNSGLELLVPYYWNISPNKDATLAARYLGKRGTQLQGEFRYLFGNYSGMASAEFLPNDDQDNEDRYFVNLKHRHALGNGWSAGYNYERVSDDQYFSDLSTQIVTTSRILLPQNLYLNWGNGIWNFSGSFQKYQRLSSAAPYEKMPQLKLTRSQYHGNWHSDLFSEVVLFEPTSDSSNIRLYSGRVLSEAAKGVRTTLYPSISYELIKPYGYIKPKVGVHYTNYNLNSEYESQSRTLPIASLDAGLYFDRDFSFGGNNMVQTLEPRMYYVYIPEKDQNSIPIFDTGIADLNFTTLFTENQFNGIDRINNANQLSIGLSTRFIDAETGAQRLSASIGQRYYYADQVVTLPNGQSNTNNSSDILAGITGNFTSSLNISAFWQYNTDEDNSVRTTITGRYNPSPGKSLNLSYSYRDNLIDQIDLSGQWPLGRGWYGVGRMNYSFFKEQQANSTATKRGLIELLAGLEYNAGCWIARSVLQRVNTATSDDANYALFFQLELGGIASIGANPLNVIRRNIPGYVRSNQIPDDLQQQYYE